MKISKYKIYESGTSVGTAIQQYAAGKFEVGGTADKLVNWAGIPHAEIVEVAKSAAVAANVAWTETYTPAVFTVGNEFILTIEYPDSRQRARKVFKETAITGSTVTTVCDGFRAQIASSGIALTGSGTTTLILTAVAGAGINYDATVGVGGTATFAKSALTLDSQISNSTTLAAKFDGVSAADFANTTDAFIVYEVKYLDHVASSDGEIGDYGYALIFVDDGTAVTVLDLAINGPSVIASDLATTIVVANANFGQSAVGAV